MAELAFFIGKGGVGKTTVSAAYAVGLAVRKPDPKVLLVSTDPAHSLGDILQKKLGANKAPIPLKPNCRLTAWEINSEELFRRFLDQHKQQLIETVEKGSLFTSAEISSLLETALPGMAEVAALLAIQEALQSGKYCDIVVDTAPFGHTLRLFSLPEQFLRLLNFLELSADRDRVLAQHFGGALNNRSAPFINEWRKNIDSLKNAFAKAKIFLVTTAESFSLNESVRCVRELQQNNSGIALHTVVLNRIVLSGGNCVGCKKRVRSARSARASLKKDFPSAEILLGEDAGIPILDVGQLMKFSAHVFDGKALKLAATVPRKQKHRQIKLSPAAWPRLAAPLSFVLGKGGVGKTTVSAGLAFFSRQESDAPVEICSVDPAPSLDDVFKTSVGDRPVPVLGDHKLRACELDSLALFRSWIAEIRAEVESATTAQHSGVHMDLSYDRALFSELLEIVPPGLDEIMAIFRIVDLTSIGSEAKKVIVDMAPTGHALELLRMPQRILVWARLLLKSLAAHRKLTLAREAAVRIAELELRARELANSFKNSKKVQTFAVMLPEPLPDYETARLLRSLDALPLAPAAIFVNRVLSTDKRTRCRRCKIAAEWQQSVLAGLKERTHPAKIFIIHDFDEELSGKSGLKKLTSQLWQLN